MGKPDVFRYNFQCRSTMKVMRFYVGAKRDSCFMVWDIRVATALVFMLWLRDCRKMTCNECWFTFFDILVGKIRGWFVHSDHTGFYDAVGPIVKGRKSWNFGIKWVAWPANPIDMLVTYSRELECARKEELSNIQNRQAYVWSFKTALLFQMFLSFQSSYI